MVLRVITLLLAVHYGCSYVIVQGPSESRKPKQEPRCSRDPKSLLAPPMLDTLVGMAPLATGVVLSSLCVFTAHCRRENPELMVAALVGGTIGAPWLLAGHLGRTRYEECEAAWRAYQYELSDTYDEAMVPPSEELCAESVAAWRATLDPEGRAQIREAMPPSCRVLIDPAVEQ